MVFTGRAVGQPAADEVSRNNRDATDVPFDEQLCISSIDGVDVARGTVDAAGSDRVGPAAVVAVVTVT